MLILYKSLVRHHVQYCISAWNPQSTLSERQGAHREGSLVQMRFTKMINNMEGKSYEKRLYCLRLWTLEERMNRQDLNLIDVFNMCNGLSSK